MTTPARGPNGTICGHGKGGDGIVRPRNNRCCRQRKDQAQFKLLEIVQAGDGMCSLLRLAQRRQQQRGQNADDGDDHEEFNERERARRRGETQMDRTVSHGNTVSG